MKKKIVNVVLFLAVLAAALGMTFYVGNNAMSVLLYNFVFLGIIAVVYVVGLFGGMFRMNRLAQSLGDAAQELEDMFKMPGRVASDKIESMNGIFHNHYLDAKMKAFTDGIAKSQEGIVDIEEYINEEDLDLHIHKKLLEMKTWIFISTRNFWKWHRTFLPVSVFLAHSWAWYGDSKIFSRRTTKQ